MSWGGVTDDTPGVTNMTPPYIRKNQSIEPVNDPMQVADILKNTKAKKAPDQRIDVHWIHEVAELHQPGDPPVVLSAKARAMLKTLVKQVGAEEARNVVTGVVSNWPEFASYTKKAAGLKTVPSMPQVGFVVTHATEAVQFCANLPEGKEELPKAGSLTGAGGQPPTSGTTTQPAPKMPTLEDIEGVLGELDNDGHASS